tara:strand:+ start:173 stop:805 length:633 start_codon:yes stop_codon:yes gene_type:complete
MRNEPIKLTDEKFKEIYTDESFRNKVAHAHGCWTSHPNSEFKYKATCDYPQNHIVTEEQIQIAKDLIVKAKEKTLEENKGKLLFVGMGMSYTKDEYNDDILNHRIRSEFKAPNGKVFFVEFGTMADYKTIRCDFSIDRTRQHWLEEKKRTMSQDGVYNYAGLEKNQCLGRYNKKNILNLVNHHFDCNFKELVVDNYNISCDGIICESPSK